MKAKIYISGRITKDETLIDVIRQFKSFENPSEIEVIIKTNGGNKFEGDSVYNYLKNLDAEIPVTTKTRKAFSIGAKIFAAGSSRIVADEEDVVGIHFARVTPKGTYTAEEVEELATELFGIKKEFIDFYSDHLNIDKDTVETLLENETVMSGKRAVELGFATSLEIVEEEIIAELNIDNLNKNEMKKSEKQVKKQNFFKKFMAEATAFFEDEEVVAELTLQDSNATDVVFPDLEEGDTPKEGDAATIDGSAIPDGSYIMPSLEDATVVFVDGKVSEVKPKEEAAEETSTEEAEVVAEEIKEVFTYSVEATNTSFEEGETLMFKAWNEDGEDYAASSGEYKLKDGSTIVTDASGVIVKKKTAEEAVVVVEEEVEANFEEVLEKITKKVTKNISAEFDLKLSEKDKEIKKLKAKQSSKEITAEELEVDGSGKKEKGNRAAEILRAARQ